MKTSEATDATRVVVLGGGFGGLSFARTLKRRLGARVAITIVDRENYSLFTPMLPEVASGAIEPRHVAPALRKALPSCRFELAQIEAVDFEKRVVSIRGRVYAQPRELPYDHLVIALGAEMSTHGIAGAEEHTFGLRTLEDARRLRNQMLGALETASVSTDAAERAALATFVVVGGGFTGVEAAGELHAFLKTIAPDIPRAETEKIRVVLVAGSTGLLEQLPKRFGVRAATMLAERGIEIVFDDEVASVDEGGLNLKSGKRFASRTIVWSAGVRPSPLLSTLDVPRSEHGAVVVGGDCAVADRPGVWAIGDCAQIPKQGGGSYPQTAQNANREGPHAARNVAAAIRGRATKPFAYRTLGMMASIGDREGLAEIGGVMISGLPAWFIWRTYYLTQLPGSMLRTRVALDWALSLLFPPSIARMT